MGDRDLARQPRASEPLPRPGSLSLACPRESNQRERHPAWRCLGVAQPVREGRLGFSTGLLPGRKVPDVLSGTPVGPHRPPLTATQGLFVGSCRYVAHRVVELKAAVRYSCRSAPSARQRNGMVASVCDCRDEVRRHAAVAHWVRSYRGRQGFRKHPPLTQPSLPRDYLRVARRGEGERCGGTPESPPFNKGALSPLRFDALRCSRSVRGSNERTKACLSRPTLLSHVLLRALALKAIFFGLLFDAKLIPWDFDSGLAPSALPRSSKPAPSMAPPRVRAGFAARTPRARAWASKRKVTRRSHGD